MCSGGPRTRVAAMKAPFNSAVFGLVPVPPMPSCDRLRDSARDRPVEPTTPAFISQSTRELVMYPILIGCLMFLCASALAAQASSAPDEPWSLSREIEIVSQWPNGERLGKDRIIGDLYRPRSHGRVPAAVIINSSGGVSALTELYYARTLVKHGMATLVVDSFRPRGVRRTGDDQGRVSQEKSNADAIAGYRWLATQDWVDASRIIVLGMSRGGETAYSAA